MFSTGHRNPQGFDWQPGTDRFVSDEHGPDGDDEINFLRKGANYGWPTISGDQSGERPGRPGGGLPRVDRAVGSDLRAQARLGLDRGLPGRRAGGRAAAAASPSAGRARSPRNEALFEGEFGRLRTVVEAPDGSLYVLTNNRDGRGSPNDGDDRILRIVPPAG